MSRVLLLEMQAGVDALIRIYMHRDLFRLQPVAPGGFEIPGVGPDYVILLARGNTLRELTIMIGVKLPAGFLVILAANLDLDCVDRMIVRTPDRAEDHSVWFLVLLSLCGCVPAEAKYRRQE